MTRCPFRNCVNFTVVTNSLKFENMCCENLEFGEITGISLRFILFAGVTVKLCDSEEVTEFGVTCPQKKMATLLMQAGAMKRNNCYMEVVKTDTTLFSSQIVTFL